MDDYKKELDYYEDRYEDILDRIIKNYKDDFSAYERKNLKKIDKTELNKIVKEENYYFASSLPIGYRRDELINDLNRASSAYKKITYLQDKFSELRKRNKLENISKEQYKKSYENKKKRKIKRKLIIGVILTGTIVAIGSTAIITKNAEKLKYNDLQDNTCIEYEVQEGETRNELQDKYDLKDIGFSYYEVSGPDRQENPDNLYAGDVIIARTTKDIAEKLVLDGKARIISVQEAVDLLSQNKNLNGEFKKYAQGKSDFVFYEPLQMKK